MPARSPSRYGLAETYTIYVDADLSIGLDYHAKKKSSGTNGKCKVRSSNLFNSNIQLLKLPIAKISQ
jgi:hypothetical protein